MKLLLDTHAFLWWLFDDPRLSESARKQIQDPAGEILVSSASAWEISTKHRLGRLPAADVLVRDIAKWIAEARFAELPVTVRHAQLAGSWTQRHRDPFDRMLAAQSRIEDAPLLSRDASLDAFGIRRIW